MFGPGLQHVCALNHVKQAVCLHGSLKRLEDHYCTFEKHHSSPSKYKSLLKDVKDATRVL